MAQQLSVGRAGRPARQGLPQCWPRQVQCASGRWSTQRRSVLCNALPTAASLGSSTSAWPQPDCTQPFIGHAVLRRQCICAREGRSAGTGGGRRHAGCFTAGARRHQQRGAGRGATAAATVTIWAVKHAWWWQQGSGQLGGRASSCGEACRGCHLCIRCCRPAIAVLGQRAAGLGRAAVRGGWGAWCIAIAATVTATAPICIVRHAWWRQHEAVKSTLLAAIRGQRLCVLATAAAHQEHCCADSHCS